MLYLLLGGFLLFPVLIKFLIDFLNFIELKLPSHIKDDEGSQHKSASYKQPA